MTWASSVSRASFGSKLLRSRLSRSSRRRSRKLSDRADHASRSILAPSAPILLPLRSRDVRPVSEAAIALAPSTPMLFLPSSRDVRPVSEAAMALAPSAPMPRFQSTSEVSRGSGRILSAREVTEALSRMTRPAAFSEDGHSSIRLLSQTSGPTIASCGHRSTRALSRQASSSLGEIVMSLSALAIVRSPPTTQLPSSMRLQFRSRTPS
jgi:hypothetical protein